MGIHRVSCQQMNKLEFLRLAIVLPIELLCNKNQIVKFWYKFLNIVHLEHWRDLRMMTGFLINRMIFFKFSQLYSIDWYKWYPKYLCHPPGPSRFLGQKEWIFAKVDLFVVKHFNSVSTYLFILAYTSPDSLNNWQVLNVLSKHISVFVSVASNQNNASRYISLIWSQSALWSGNNQIDITWRTVRNVIVWLEGFDYRVSTPKPVTTSCMRVSGGNLSGKNFICIHNYFTNHF